MDGKLIYTAMLFNDGKNAFDSQSMSWMTADRDAVVEDRLFRKCISDTQTQFVIFDVYTTADHSVFFIRDILTCRHCVFPAVPVCPLAHRYLGGNPCGRTGGLAGSEAGAAGDGKAGLIQSAMVGTASAGMGQV